MLKNTFITLLALVVLGLITLIAFRPEYFKGLLSLKQKTVTETNTEKQATSTYANQGLGVSFSYPSSYVLTERTISINKESVHVITLIAKGQTIPANGEGGTAMTISVFAASSTAPLADWLKSVTGTSPAPLGGFDYQEGTIGGRPAIFYTATGLYESDNGAVQGGGHGYIFSSTWMTRDDRILVDFGALLHSVSFSH